MKAQITSFILKESGLAFRKDEGRPEKWYVKGDDLTHFILKETLIQELEDALKILKENTL